MGLESQRLKMPAQLSGGQQQRVALARAMITRPDVILFDEPLSNLDAKLRESVRFEIKELQRQYHLTSIYVTHDQAEALAMSDKIVVLNAGNVEQIGAPEEIYYRPTSRFVADFIARPISTQLILLLQSNPALGEYAAPWANFTSIQPLRRVQSTAISAGGRKMCNLSALIRAATTTLP